MIIMVNSFNYMSYSLCIFLRYKENNEDTLEFDIRSDYAPCTFSVEGLHIYV